MKEDGKIGIDGIDASGEIRRASFYDEEAVVGFLNLMKLPQANSEGYFELDGEKYYSVTALAKSLGLAEDSVSKRLKRSGIKGIDGRAAMGQIYLASYYPLEDARIACSDLLQELPKANSEGVLKVDDKLLGNLSYFARRFSISQKTVGRAIRLSGITAVNGKDILGRVGKFFLFEEMIPILPALGKLKTDESGRIIFEGLVYKTREELIRALDVDNKTTAEENFTIKPKSLEDLPRAYAEGDLKGFFCKDGKIYGTPYAWSSHLHHADNQTWKRLFQKHGKPGIDGIDASGKIQRAAFHNEEEAATCLKMLKLPQTNTEGYFELDGKKYYCINMLMKILDVTEDTLVKRFNKNGIKGIDGRAASGQFSLGGYYTLEDARNVCSDLLKKLPKASSKGVIKFKKFFYGHLGYFAKRFSTSYQSVEKRISEAGIVAIEGRDVCDRVKNFYPIEEVIKLLPAANKSKVDENGEVLIEGLVYGTREALARALGVTYATAANRSKTLSAKEAIGRNGTVVNVYPLDQEISQQPKLTQPVSSKKTSSIPKTVASAAKPKAKHQAAPEVSTPTNAVATQPDLSSAEIKKDALFIFTLLHWNIDIDVAEALLRIDLEKGSKNLHLGIIKKIARDCRIPYLDAEKVLEVLTRIKQGHSKTLIEELKQTPTQKNKALDQAEKPLNLEDFLADWKERILATVTDEKTKDLIERRFFGLAIEGILKNGNSGSPLHDDAEIRAANIQIFVNIFGINANLLGEFFSQLKVYKQKG